MCLPLTPAVAGAAAGAGLDAGGDNAAEEDGRAAVPDSSSPEELLKGHRNSHGGRLPPTERRGRQIADRPPNHPAAHRHGVWTRILSRDLSLLCLLSENGFRRL